MVIRNSCVKTGNKNSLISTLIKHTNKVLLHFAVRATCFTHFKPLFWSQLKI